MNYRQLLSRYPLISDQVDKTELAVILRELSMVLEQGITGDIVEFGCYTGTTSLFLQRLLADSDRQLHVYDSFEGLPVKTGADQSVAGDQFQAGELAVSKKQFITEFKKANLPLPQIHKGWFSQLTSADVPQQIAFAFLDGDFYESILDSLKLVWPRLSPGATLIIDDYLVSALPGVEVAIHDFWQGRLPAIHHEASLAIIKMT